jgi:hypothetical protein
MTSEKKLLDPETNVILVSNKRDLRFFVYLAKVKIQINFIDLFE